MHILCTLQVQENYDWCNYVNNLKRTHIFMSQQFQMMRGEHVVNEMKDKTSGTTVSILSRNHIMIYEEKFANPCQHVRIKNVYNATTLLAFTSPGSN